VIRRKRHWQQNPPSIYCQHDEHDAGYTWGSPLHPVACKRNADSSLSRHADVQSMPRDVVRRLSLVQGHNVSVTADGYDVQQLDPSCDRQPLDTDP
jgi:hypothetical protein